MMRSTGSSPAMSTRIVTSWSIERTRLALPVRRRSRPRAPVALDDLDEPGEDLLGADHRALVGGVGAVEIASSSG